MLHGTLPPATAVHTLSTLEPFPPTSPSHSGNLVKLVHQFTGARFQSPLAFPFLHLDCTRCTSKMPAAPKQRKIAIVGSRSVGMGLSCPVFRIFLPGSLSHVLCVPGKSSLTVRFVEHHFVESYYPTIENTFSRIIKYNGQDYATEIVDTAGQVCVPSPTRGFCIADRPQQDEYSILNSKHFIGIHGYIIVYSVTSRQSFEMVRVIRDKILNHLVRLPFPDCWNA